MYLQYLPTLVNQHTTQKASQRLALCRHYEPGDTLIFSYTHRLVLGVQNFECRYLCVGGGVGGSGSVNLEFRESDVSPGEIEVKQD